MAGSVAVIGAGPGGLAAARWLLSQGFEPTIFDQAPVLGGQWTGLPGLSGVWPTMHTNTSRVLTAFSDLEHETGNVYPSGRDILAYLGPGSLCRDVRAHVAHPVRHTGRAPQRIRRRMAGASLRHDRALRQGRGGNRQVPVPRHPARSGARHVRRFGWRDLHMPVPGPRTLLRQACARRGRRDQRPGDRRRTRPARRDPRRGHPAAAAVRAAEVRRGCPLRPPDIHAIRSHRERAPARRGDRPAAERDRCRGRWKPGAVRRARARSVALRRGVTLSQQYLPLVAEGRITVRPWPASITNTAVTFSDGSAGEFDGIVFGTGFDLHLPFLSEDICAALDLDAVHMDADRYTFRPDLPGLAFVGMWDQSGGYFVPLELQARWIAYTWGGAISPMSAAA